MTNEKSDEDFEASHIDDSRLPCSTMLHGIASESKRVTMPKWVHEALAYVAAERNRKLTQGVLAYECLLFKYDELFDRIDSLERTIETNADRRIDFEEVDELQVMTEEEAREKIRSKIEEPDKKRTQVELWLPKPVLDTSPWRRGWGSKLEDGFVTAYASAFSDRLDRLECKEQLIEYVQDGVTPTHSVAVDIVNGEMGGYVGSPEILSEVIVTEPDDYYAIADELTTVDKQNTKMKELYDNEDNLNKGHFVTILKKAHGHGSGYAENRVEEWCEEYELFNHAPIDEKAVTDENFVELATQLVDDESNEAQLVNQLFATTEENGHDTMSLENVSKLMKEAGFIRTATTKLAGKKLQRYNEKYGMASFRSVKTGTIYLSTSTNASQ